MIPEVWWSEETGEIYTRSHPEYGQQPYIGFPGRGVVGPGVAELPKDVVKLGQDAGPEDAS